MLGRMLLSHNFDLPIDLLPALSRAQFSDVFCLGLAGERRLQCKPVEHPHWITEILFPTVEFSPQQVGVLCAEALATQRQLHLAQPSPQPTILILAGLKTTPPTSDSPTALQPGDWGVDVVETLSSQAFLQSIAWDATIATKAPDSVFKIEQPLKLS